MMLRLRSGQCTLEYVIILAIVVGAIVGAAAVFKSQIAGVYNTVYPSTSNPAGSGSSGGG